MRPQDIAVLLKVILWEDRQWQYRDLATELDVSVSEISTSLKRNALAGLYFPSTQKVARKGLVEFIRYGLHFVFPVVPGPMAVGVPTAHSHPRYKQKLIVDMDYVWPHDHGTVRGQAIAPLYKGAPTAALRDEAFHELLASIDVLRVGNVRESKLALEQIEKRLL